MKKRLLAIAAHPDDEALSFAGLLTRAARLGWGIDLAWATVGEKSSSPAANARWSEALEVAEALKASAHDFELPDGHVKSADFIPLADSLVAQIRPQLVVWPCGVDLYQHQDHRAVHDGMLNVAGRSKYGASCWCIAQPPVEPDAWFSHPQLFLGFEEEEIRQSMSLMSMYHSEANKHFAKANFLYSRAQQWAARTRTHVAFAEPFVLIRGVPPTDVFSFSHQIKSDIAETVFPADPGHMTVVPIN